MDVRCDRCKTEYEFDEATIPEAGVTVQCTQCQHVFRVKRRSEAPASTAPLKVVPPAEKPREWRVRQANGNVFTLRELTTLQRWIVERKVARADEISITGESWKRLGDIPDLSAFFQVVDEAQKAAQLEALQAQGLLTPGKSAPQPATATLAEVMRFEQAAAITEPRPLPPEAPRPAVPQPPPMPPPVPQGMSGSAGFAFGPGDIHEARSSGTRPRPSQPITRFVPEPIPEEVFASSRTRVAVGALLVAILVGGAGAYAYLRVWRPAQEAAKTPPAPAAPVARTEPSPEAAVVPAPPVAAQLPAVASDAGTNPAATAPVTAAATPAPDTAAHPAASSDATADAGATVRVASAEKPAPATTATPAPAKPAHDFDYYMAQGDRLRGRERPEAALDAYNHAQKEQPDRAEPVAGRGLAELDLGRKDDAVASFQQALELNPRYGVALMGMAEAYRALDRKEDAVKYYQLYLDISPNGSEATVARSAIERLKP